MASWPEEALMYVIQGDLGHVSKECWRLLLRNVTGHTSVSRSCRATRVSSPNATCRATPSFDMLLFGMSAKYLAL